MSTQPKATHAGQSHASFVTTAKLMKLEVLAKSKGALSSVSVDRQTLLSLVEEIRAYRLSGAEIDLVAMRLATGTEGVRYFLNPGDMLEMRTVHQHEATSLKGDLYRWDGHELQQYDRITSQWYGYTREELGNVPIKVLQCAGLHP